VTNPALPIRPGALISSDAGNLLSVGLDAGLLVLLGRLGILEFDDQSTGDPVDAFIEAYIEKGVTHGLELYAGGCAVRITSNGVSIVGTLAMPDGLVVSGAQQFTQPISVAVGTSQNNWSPSSWSSRTMFRVTPSAAVTITGMAALTGARKTLFNVSGSNTITIAHESASSTAGNRVICPGNANYALGPSSAVDIWYDPSSSRWRIIR